MPEPPREEFEDYGTNNPDDVMIRELRKMEDEIPHIKEAIERSAHSYDITGHTSKLRTELSEAEARIAQLKAAIKKLRSHPPKAN